MLKFVRLLCKKSWIPKFLFVQIMTQNYFWGQKVSDVADGPFTEFIVNNRFCFVL